MAKLHATTWSSLTQGFKQNNKEHVVMNFINCYRTHLITAIVVLVSSTLLFTTACSAVTQENNPEGKKQPSQAGENTPKTQADDFAKIQTALRSLDDSLATQSKSNKDVKPSDPTASLNTPTTTSPATGAMKMGMGKGKNKKQMGGKSCMGMMCKMMMKNNSMMGMPPKPNTPATSPSPSGVTLPGASGALHLYHVGEQAFFLNYKETLELTDGQYQTLLTIQTEWESTQKSIAQQRSTLEASLWELTAKGLPQYDNIKDTISEIEALNSALRLQFITSVGKAVAVLTSSQIGKINALWLAEQEAGQ